MATISFCTKKSKKGEPSTIYVRYSKGRGNDQNVSSGQTIYPEFWSKKTGAIKQNFVPEKEPGFTQEKASKLEATLSDLGRFVSNEANAIAGQQLPPKWLKNVVKQYYDSLLPEEPEQKPETLNEYIERFLKEAKEGKPLCQGKRSFAKESLRPWVGFKQAFDAYQGIYDDDKRKKMIKDNIPFRPLNEISFNDIDRDFYNDFLKYLTDNGKTLNYTGRLIKQLKNIMQRAGEEGLHNNKEIEKKYFKSMAEDVDSIYLTHDDIDAIKKVDLSLWEDQRQIRDVFLVGCYVGQRYSDYSRITPDNIKEMGGGKVVELNQKKTNQKVVVPITPECDAILKSYDYRLPKTWPGKLNEGIRAIGQSAGLKEMITTTRTEGGRKITRKVMKYKLMSSHTARRTALTLWYLDGVNAIDIMKLSGHKTETQLMRYIKVSEAETAIRLMKHDAFTSLRIAR